MKRAKKYKLVKNNKEDFTIEIRKEIKTFADNRVWITKKSRIEAESRMNRNHLFSQILINYYTFIVLAFSIWSLLTSDTLISLWTVISSVGLFGISIFITSINFREKAIQFKSSYISLNDLEFKLVNLSKETNTTNNLQLKFEKLKRLYNSTLSRTDNHAEIDYIKTKISHNYQVSKTDIIFYLKYIFLISFIKFVLLFTPLLLIIIFFIKK